MQKRLRPLLGTFVEIAILDPGKLTDQQILAATNAAFTRCEQIQQQLSFHHPGSDLTRLNRSVLDWVELHPRSIQCLKLARALTRLSQGKFNCTLGKALVDKGVLPAPDITTRPVLNLGSWHDIEITGQRARLRRPVWVTLDGIAKGFAVDLAIRELQFSGVASASINAGGDLRVYGPAIIPIVVRDHTGRDHPMGGLQDAAVATSTSHYSAEQPGLLLGAKANELHANTWTVISTSAWRADALTKVAANSTASQRAATIRALGGNWVPLHA